MKNEFLLTELFSAAGPQGRISVEEKGLWSRRSLVLYGNLFLLDQFEKGPDCLFIRVGGTARLRFGLNYQVKNCQAGGWILSPEDKDKEVYWLPLPPKLRKLDRHGRILCEEIIKPESREEGAQISSLTLTAPEGRCVDMVFWRFNGSAQERYIKELAEILPIEKQKIFLSGSHESLEGPGDVYENLIHGAVYDRRFVWPHHWKTYAENEAHSLYLALEALEKATGKAFYRILQKQLVISLIARQAADGGWYHGFWTEDMECHYRLHAGGVQLLTKEYTKCPGSVLRSALEKAALFLAQQTDKIDAGIWFLHDSLEKEPNGYSQIPSKYIKSRALGKSPSNMLILNTHLNTIITLHKYQEATGNRQFENLVQSAKNVTKSILSLRPADWLYRPLFWAVNRNLAPKCLISNLAYVKARFPRLVMPSGFIDRHLSLKGFSLAYHIVNLMDLLRYKHRFPEEKIDDIIENAVVFIHKYGILKYFSKSKAEKYALGFWVEALYLAGTEYGKNKYQELLYEAINMLEEAGLGIQPSLIGSGIEGIR